MKKLFICINALIFISILSACDGQKNAKSPATNAKVEESTETGTVESSASDMEKAKEAEGNIEESIAGSMILDKTVSNLTQKLALSDQQAVGVRDLLTKNFISSGHDLAKQYPIEESKKLRKELMKNSSQAILAILDTNQKEKYQEVLNRQ